MPWESLTPEEVAQLVERERAALRPQQRAAFDRYRVAPQVVHFRSVYPDAPTTAYAVARDGARAVVYVPALLGFLTGTLGADGAVRDATVNSFCPAGELLYELESLLEAEDGSRRFTTWAPAVRAALVAGLTPDDAAARLAELEVVAGRLREEMPAIWIPDWLLSGHAHLGGRRPVDVWREGRLAAVLAALAAEAPAGEED
jgi:hypothetical protein